MEAASQWSNMPSDQCLIQKKYQSNCFLNLCALFGYWVQNNSPKSNIYSTECISNTETPAHPTKMKTNRRNAKYSIFVADSVYIIESTLIFIYI